MCTYNLCSPDNDIAYIIYGIKYVVIYNYDQYYKVNILC